MSSEFGGESEQSRKLSSGPGAGYVGVRPGRGIGIGIDVSSFVQARLARNMLRMMPSVQTDE